MVTKFLRRANEFQLVDSAALNVHDVLPPANYIVKQDPQTGALYLEMVDNFQGPSKFYGNIIDQAKRILCTFNDRKSGTGVLMSGEKGSGKTLLARTISMEAAKEGIPTIIINAPWAGDAFFSFINSITQPTILMFDEFEKVYSGKENTNKNSGSLSTESNYWTGDNQAQNAILTLLDGVFQNKKLSLLTCNDKFGINRNMLNRPGRIFYALEFHGLPENFVREYSQDNLKNKDHVGQIIRVASMFSDFNFDMLKSLIEEMNRYDETAADALEMLNISPERDYSTWKVEAIPANNQKVFEKYGRYPETIESPLSQKQIKARVYLDDGKPDDSEDRETEEYWMVFTRDNVIQLTSDRMVLRNLRGDILNLERVRYASSSWREFTKDNVS